MPPALTYIEDVKSKAATDLDEAFNKEIQDRQKQYLANWKYYYGDHKKQLKKDKTNTDDNIIINLIELLIDKGVSSLMGTTDQGTIKGPDFDLPEPEQPQLAQRVVRGIQRVMQPQRESEADAYLDKVWEANVKPLFLHDLALAGGVCGHNFVKIVPDGIVDPDDDTKTLPRLVVINPMTIAVFWDANDINRVLWYRIQYENNEMLYREDTIRLRNDDGSNSPDGWEIRSYSKKKFGGDGWQAMKPVVWNHVWPPIVDWKNFPRPFEYYGLNDIRASGNINDGINFTASNTQRIIKHHAHPKTIGTGFTAKKLTEDPIGGFYTIDAADARIYNLEMQSDLSSSMNYMLFLRRAFFDGGRELDPATVQDKLGALTNFGLRVLFRDSLEKTGTKRLLYGHGLRSICRYVLELGGFGTNQKVLDKWPDPLPTDSLQTARALQIDRNNGLSQSTYLERRGFDPTMEARNRENEMGEQVMASTITTQGAMVDKYRSMTNGQRQLGAGNGQNNPTGNAR